MVKCTLFEEAAPSQCQGLSVVIGPTNSGATIVVAQALCLTVFNLSPTQNTCLFTDGGKAGVCDDAAPQGQPRCVLSAASDPGWGRHPSLPLTQCFA